MRQKPFFWFSKPSNCKYAIAWFAISLSVLLLIDFPRQPPKIDLDSSINPVHP